MNPITSAKTYWSILKTLLNSQNSRCIPTPLKGTLSGLRDILAPERPLKVRKLF